MNREAFVQQVDMFFRQRPCDNAQSAKDALITLYDYLISKAKESENLSQGDLRWSQCWFQIQQAMTWSPLRLFWRVLAQDDLVAIRASAKGNLCEASGEYWNDPEVGLIGQANLPLILSGATMRLQDEMANDLNFQRAIQQWAISTQGLTFTPVLKITTIDLGQVPPEDDLK